MASTSGCCWPPTLAGRLDLGGPPLPLAEVAAQYQARQGRHALVRWLRDQLHFTGKGPQPFHQRLVQLAQKHGARTFITTAYDSLLAVTFEQAGVARDGILRNSDFRFADPGHPCSSGSTVRWSRWTRWSSPSRTTRTAA